MQAMTYKGRDLWLAGGGGALIAAAVAIAPQSPSGESRIN